MKKLNTKINPLTKSNEQTKSQANKAKTRFGVGADIFTLKSPRITEKASMLQEKNVFVFNVPLTATKRSVSKAIEAQYKVHPVKVNMVRVLAKNVFVRNKAGKTNRGKKAYVFLKKGETIKLV